MTRRRRDRWYRQALCQDFANLPWVADPRDCPAAAVAAMRAVCAACPVRAECEETVLVEHVTAGFWAGAHRDPALGRAHVTGGAA